jgi:hypothetical protein
VYQEGSNIIFLLGEHVIGKEVESALQASHGNKCSQRIYCRTSNPSSGLPYHEWFIEFEQEPEDKSAFAEAIDNAMRKQNIYYDDLIVGTF